MTHQEYEDCQELSELRAEVRKLREENVALRSAICVFCKENSRWEGLISGCQCCRYREVKSSDSD